jgi:hypothetical protein
VLTANELRQVVKIRDPESAAEVLLFKRELDGRIAAVSGGGGAMELKTDADVSNKSRPWRLGRAGTARGYRTTRDTPATPWRPTEREG